MESNPILQHMVVPESNVFYMARFRETDYHREIADTVEYLLDCYGLELVRADDPNWSAPTLWDRVHFGLDASRYGVAVFETIDEPDINPNVSLELGYMMALSRPCLLLKEKRLKALPSDLCGHLYKEFDSREIGPSVGRRLREWLQETGIRKRGGQTMLVYVSIGGTCRCAIAKAITQAALRHSKQAAHIRVESRAIQRPNLGSATKSGRQAIAKALGEDLLGNHQPRNAGVCFLHEADLILAMDSYVLQELQNIHLEYRGSPAERETVRRDIAAKTFLVTEFFGAAGSIADPYPDKEDQASEKRYDDCVGSLRQLIEPNLDRVSTFLHDKRLPGIQCS